MTAPFAETVIFAVPTGTPEKPTNPFCSADVTAVKLLAPEDTVTVADPIYSRITVSRDQFEKIFAERGGQCVILTE